MPKSKQEHNVEMINHRKTGRSKTEVKKSSKSSKFLLIIILIAVGVSGYYLNNRRLDVQNYSPTKSITSPAKKIAAKTQIVTKPKAQVSTACAQNTLSQYVVVSISARHMWACDESSQVYDSPVVTGIEYLPADLTPVGTYYVYAKETNQRLTGCDTTGCWNDFVNYWMPFLSNEYGVYGFHDATWRSPDAFGNISPDSSDASHGCVELPLATATWLFGWAQVGLKVTIEA